MAHSASCCWVFEDAEIGSCEKIMFRTSDRLFRKKLCSHLPCWVGRCPVMLEAWNENVPGTNMKQAGERININ